MRIDIFWLPGTRDDSPDGRMPTLRHDDAVEGERRAAQLIPARVLDDRREVLVRHPQPDLVNLPFLEEVHRRLLSAGLSGGTTLGSTCGGPLTDGEDSHAAKHTNAANPIAHPRLLIAAIALSPTFPIRAQADHGKTRATSGQPIHTASPDAGLPSGNGAVQRRQRFETGEIATLKTTCGAFVTARSSLRNRTDFLTDGPTDAVGVFTVARGLKLPICSEVKSVEKGETHAQAGR